MLGVIWSSEFRMEFWNMIDPHWFDRIDIDRSLVIYVRYYMISKLVGI